MTFRELLRERQPDAISDRMLGGCFGCPDYWGLEPKRKVCPQGMLFDCEACWDREAPETEAADEYL